MLKKRKKKKVNMILDKPLSNIEREDLVRYAIEQGQIPRYLYKYWSKSSVIRFLNSHKIMFSQYKDFNDPFECSANIDTNNTSSEWAAFLKSQGVSPGEIIPIVNNMLMDKQAASRIIKEAILATISKSGIFCMTPKPDNLLMWAHYSDQHKGACIKFDLLTDVTSFNFPKKVDYSDEYYNYNYLRNQEMASKTIWHKSLDWAYEEEYRVVKPTFHGLCEINPDAVVEIIFGCRCPEEDEKDIRDAADIGTYKKLTYRHARMSSSKFQLIIE